MDFLYPAIRSEFVILTALIAASVLLADVTPAAAAATTPAPAAVAASTEKPPEGRLVCHSEAQPGSLQTKKVCYRAAPPKPAADAKAAQPAQAPTGGA